MSRYHSYMLSARMAIESYERGTVFSRHIKSFFSASKKFGSRDRKLITALCYAYFRVGRAFGQQSIEQSILDAVFLTGGQSEILEAFNYIHKDQVSLAVSEKLALMKMSAQSLFPFGQLLGADINHEAFALSFLEQPSLFVRLRPGRAVVVKDKLAAAGISFKQVSGSCLSIPTNSNVDEVIELNRDAVVQDLNSQKVFDFPGIDSAPLTSNKTAWDCCAASGGKSILLYDKLNKKVDLTVSDIRETILENLAKRLREAGVPVTEQLVCDLTKSSPFMADRKFDIIICDAPCTGSGTWSRTPEQLFSFKVAQATAYHDRQIQIALTASQHLKSGGLFFYITCSVFKTENEDIVSELERQTGMKALHTTYLPGYENRADTMFVSVLTQD